MGDYSCEIYSDRSLQFYTFHSGFPLWHLTLVYISESNQLYLIRHSENNKGTKTEKNHVA